LEPLSKLTNQTRESAVALSKELFNLTGRVAIVTGGAGLLGPMHAEILAAVGAHVVLLDLKKGKAASEAKRLSEEYETDCIGLTTDITNASDIEAACREIVGHYKRIDILINNAANNPDPIGLADLRFEHLSLEHWEADIRVGLTGAFLCSRTFGSEMVKQGKGVIVNVASDLSVIAPDQRIYKLDGLSDDEQPVKQVTHSVVKTGLIGLTRYLATYWAHAGVRVNAISPGGVYNSQPTEFLSRIEQLIPLGRLARPDEIQGAILFLCSDASSYMTGHNLVLDGGRSIL
jgi:NAD(P)-dependent dehydrogenase (short-subunit alcohol dehydrogenase family)